MSSSDRPEYVQQNIANWTRANAEYTDASAARAWAQEEITWGVFSVPESELDLLGDVHGLDVVELGCGTAYFSAWLSRRGARVVGVDVSRGVGEYPCTVRSKPAFDGGAIICGIETGGAKRVVTDYSGRAISGGVRFFHGPRADRSRPS